MRSEIAEEARILDGTSQETRDAVKEEEEEEDNNKELSDGSETSKKDKKIYKKTKGKSKGHIKRSKMADSELDAEWDYKLELIRNGSVKERRGSDAEVPLRAKTDVSASH
jgi:hypothetical protein